MVRLCLRTVRVDAIIQFSEPGNFGCLIYNWRTVRVWCQTILTYLSDGP
jgi:hypothetical protein